MEVDVCLKDDDGAPAKVDEYDIRGDDDDTGLQARSSTRPAEGSVTVHFSKSLGHIHKGFVATACGSVSLLCVLSEH